MKLKNMVLTGVLVMAMSCPAVFAEEAVSEAPEELEDVLAEASEILEGTLTELSKAAGETLAGVSEVVKEESSGLLEALFGEDGPLADALPEGTDIDTMVDTVKEQMSQASRELSEVADVIAENIGSKASELVGELDIDSVKEYADEFLSLLTGEGDFDFSALDAMFEINEKIQEAEEQFMLDHNSEMMDPADVQIVSTNCVYTDDFDAEEIRAMRYMIQNNYTIDEENQLWFVSGAGDVVLFRHQKDEEDNYPVIDASFAEDGENYLPSIEAMCDEVGIDVDECMDTIEFAKVMVLYDLKNYLSEHPDIAGIEYDGAIRTEEELMDLWDEKLDEYADSLEEEELTEDATEESVLEF